MTTTNDTATTIDTTAILDTFRATLAKMGITMQHEEGARVFDVFYEHDGDNEARVLFVEPSVRTTPSGRVQLVVGIGSTDKAFTATKAAGGIDHMLAASYVRARLDERLAFLKAERESEERKAASHQIADALNDATEHLPGVYFRACDKDASRVFLVVREDCQAITREQAEAIIVTLNSAAGIALDGGAEPAPAPVAAE